MKLRIKFHQNRSTSGGGRGRSGRSNKARNDRNSDASADAPTGLTRSGVSDARNRRKHGR